MWWEYNKAAVIAHDYAKATWLPSASTEKALVDADRKKDDEYNK